MKRRDFLLSAAAPALAQRRPPVNVVLIFADDLGYGDLACYGHPTIRTPHLDRLASEGVRFTQFYVSASLCTPSRGSLMTGRYPMRTGLNLVLFPHSTGGLPESEVTVAELLKQRGYATQIVGKWHLGHLPQYLPTRHGFDSFFGLPYSNDMSWKTIQVYADIARELGQPHPVKVIERYRNLQPLPLMRNETTLETEPDQTQLTQRYTTEANAFMRKSVAGGKPFFLYFAHTFPHVPLYASKKFHGASLRGPYGDTVEELDWSVGEIMKTLVELKIEENTLVLFTSDNGGGLMLGSQGGSNGPLRDGKQSTWEGGVREPFIARWKGRIRPGQVCREVASTLDILPTLARLSGAALPKDVVLDGSDLAPLLWEGKPRKQPDLFYHQNGRLRGVRRGPWKLNLVAGADKKDVAELYQVENDISERLNLAAAHPEKVAELTEAMRAHLASFQPGPPQK
jgi:arylsulfatase A